MSQNKTVIQGLEPETNLGGAPYGASSNNFYTRGNRSAARGTVVPGMMEAQAGPSSNINQTSAPQPRKTVQSGKPIVGFLYSISRTPLGEYWPLQMGRNTIGQAEDCDIMLAEGTVSSNHAVIVTRQVKNGIIAAITDSQSTNGTMINNEYIELFEKYRNLVPIFSIEGNLKNTSLLEALARNCIDSLPPAHFPVYLAADAAFFPVKVLYIELVTPVTLRSSTSITFAAHTPSPVTIITIATKSLK